MNGKIATTQSYKVGVKIWQSWPEEAEPPKMSEIVTGIGPDGKILYSGGVVLLDKRNRRYQLLIGWSASDQPAGEGK